MYVVTHTGTFLSLYHSHILAASKTPKYYTDDFSSYISPLLHGNRRRPLWHFSLFLVPLCLCVCSSRHDGSRWSTAGHAAAGGLGGFSLCPTFRSIRPRAARCHAGQDGAKQCSHEAQQPARAPTDAPVPNDAQW